MGTLRFDGVWFAIYSRDHPPPHAHATYGGIAVIVQFDFVGRKVEKAARIDAVMPGNASRSALKHILRAAERHLSELQLMWERTHGAN